MTGNVGPLLRGLYQQSSPSTSIAAETAAYSECESEPLSSRMLRAAALACTAHLCMLLVSGAGKADLLLPLWEGANEASFFEELFLETACRLHSLDIALEVDLGYLSSIHCHCLFCSYFLCLIHLSKNRLF